VPTWYVEARTTEIVKIPHRCNSALFHAVLSVGARRSSVGGDGVVLTGGGWWVLGHGLVWSARRRKRLLVQGCRRVSPFRSRFTVRCVYVVPDEEGGKKLGYTYTYAILFGPMHLL
jgi:hypothetical protein